MRSLYYRAAHLVGRADAINLDESDLSDARAQGKAAASETSGTYRYQRHGGITVRTPNDNTFDSWGTSEFYRTIDGLTGCTAVMVTSPAGVFAVHIWESAFLAATDMVVAQLGTANKDAKSKAKGAGAIPGAYEYRGQFGLNDYGKGKVATGAWSDASQVHISVMVPTKGAGGAIVSQANLASTLSESARYTPAVQALLNKVKASVGGSVPDANIQIYAYHEETANSQPTGTKGTMTAYNNGAGKFAVYAEDFKLFEADVGACDSSADCDESSTGCCVVQK